MTNPAANAIAQVHTLPILMYHNVGPAPAADPLCLTIAPDQFERQMRYLVNHEYQTIWPSDWLAARREGKPLSERAVMVTFDDGYAEMVEHAFPVLRRYGLKAAVYVVTRRLGLSNIWDKEVEGYRMMRLMTSEQISQWAGREIEFGSHTRTHPHLTGLGEQRLTDEIEGSKDDLQSILGAEVLSFAYPYGDGVKSSIVREHLSAVYQLGMTVLPGLNPIGTNPYEVRRLMILPGISLQEFERRLHFQKRLATLVRERLPRPIATAARLGWHALRGWRA